MKSVSSDYLELASAIYIDACAKCVADVSDLRDLQTMQTRVKDEGVSFFTITLPEFARSFERSLADGCIGPTTFPRWRKFGVIPAFLRGFLGRIFNFETGRIYDEVANADNDFTAIVGSVRQICLAFKKSESACTPNRVSKAIVNFANVEQSFSLFSLSEEDVDMFCHVSRVLWDNLFGNLLLSELRPRHGPGATAERITGNGKYIWQSWYGRLEPYFPILDSAYSNSAIEAKELELVTVIPEEHELPVRVVCVPKTMKGPRIIAIEPCCMQYTQQAIRRLLYRAIESHDYTSGHINFRDQTVNQELALISSKDSQLATIDLSDASDRVPRDLALVMFRSNPDLRDAIDACRSTSAILPDGTIVSPLAKFASMGSALCFPIESMYFYTICVAALLVSHGLPVSFENAFMVSRSVYVYGDDIIVPSAHATVVLEYLQKYNCKVNVHKTFVTGKFRESCGVDAYNGELVTPVYIHHERPKDKLQAKELISWVASANLFYKHGFWQTAQLMYVNIERILGELPYVSETSPGLGRTTFHGYRSFQRWSRKYHRFEVQAWVPRPVYRTDTLDGYGALQKSLSNLERNLQDNPDVAIQPDRDLDDPRDKFHLERSALHGAVTLKLRWIAAT